MLSFLIKIYEPIIITANCNLTVLISRWYFCEPNKLSFTILGRLHNLLSFIKVQRITKLTKQFYSQEQPKQASWPTARLGSGAAAGAAQRRHGSGPAGGRKRCGQQRQQARGPAQRGGPAAGTAQRGSKRGRRRGSGSGQRGRVRAAQ